MTYIAVFLAGVAVGVTITAIVIAGKREDQVVTACYHRRMNPPVAKPEEVK